MSRQRLADNDSSYAYAMHNTKNYRDLALAFHRRLPNRIRTYLHGIGFDDTFICKYCLGWGGEQIAIPITNRSRQVVSIYLASAPCGAMRPEVAPLETSVELYGWERVNIQREELVICDGIFDRLALEARGFFAVTSTGGVDSFLASWGEELQDIPKIYLCFRNDTSGDNAAEAIAAILPRSRIVYLPEEVGSGGIFEFFNSLQKGAADFRQLLNVAQPLVPASIRLSNPEGNDK